MTKSGGFQLALVWGSVAVFVIIFVILFLCLTDYQLCFHNRPAQRKFTDEVILNIAAVEHEKVEEKIRNGNFDDAISNDTVHLNEDIVPKQNGVEVDGKKKDAISKSSLRSSLTLQSNKVKPDQTDDMNVIENPSSQCNENNTNSDIITAKTRVSVSSNNGSADCSESNV